MRPWESEPDPTMLGGRADSQDRMDQVMTMPWAG